MATSSIMVNTFGPAIVNTGGFAAVSSATNITLTAGGASTLSITPTPSGASIDVVLPLAEASIEGKIYKITNALAAAATAKSLIIKNSAGSTLATLVKSLGTSSTPATSAINSVTYGCYYTGSGYDWAQLEVGWTALA